MGTVARALHLCGSGVVDADYRGSVGVILFNHSDVDFEFRPGDWIAEMFIELIVTPRVIKVDDLDFPALNVDELRVKTLSSKAVCPSRASGLSAGYDLSSATEMTVPAHGKALIPTNLCIAIPDETVAQIAGRSELAQKYSIKAAARKIDAEHCGPVDVILFNYTDVEFVVKPGHHIAQVTIIWIMTPDPVKVDNMDSAIRGTGGYGSTGV